MIRLLEREELAFTTESFWESVIESLPLEKILISSKKPLPTGASHENTEALLSELNVWERTDLETDFHPDNSPNTLGRNNYSREKLLKVDARLSDDFQKRMPSIIEAFPRFIDQIRFTHYINMIGKEDIMLQPAQTRRLKKEGVEAIAGEIRKIQTGFGHYRFNSPRPEHLEFLLGKYIDRIEEMKPHVTEDNVHDYVSYAQYYFAALHPFYERCGRTSEELMYLLFQQTVPEETTFVSDNGRRDSPERNERMVLINDLVGEFNAHIAKQFGITPSHYIRKTPEIYQGITAKYFPERLKEVYSVKRDKPLYYKHPVEEVLGMYYLAMESLLHDEIVSFDLDKPSRHIRFLGHQLRLEGKKEYHFQK